LPARPTGKPAAKGAGKLQVVNGPPGYPGKIIPLTTAKSWVVGRDPQADVPIPSERISRRHCQLEPTDDGLWVLVDMGSSNGTLVNQEKIAGRKVLLGGEYIQVGDVLLRFLDS
jgi:pSer/pThr/pTyr-binding forkhead associated (FHA) protein